jgi:hypothetical protein
MEPPPHPFFGITNVITNLLVDNLQQQSTGDKMLFFSCHEIAPRTLQNKNCNMMTDSSRGPMAMGLALAEAI